MRMDVGSETRRDDTKLRHHNGLVLLERRRSVRVLSLSPEAFIELPK